LEKNHLAIWAGVELKPPKPRLPCYRPVPDAGVSKFIAQTYNLMRQLFVKCLAF